MFLSWNGPLFRKTNIEQDTFLENVADEKDYSNILLQVSMSM